MSKNLLHIYFCNVYIHIRSYVNLRLGIKLPPPSQAHFDDALLGQIRCQSMQET
jgi:hypothetical protein